MLQDTRNDTRINSIVNAQAITTNTTTTGSALSVPDESCYAYLFCLASQTVKDGTFTMQIQDSDDDSVYAPVDDQFLLNAEDPAVFTAFQDNLYRIQGYNGHKQYVRAVIISTGVTLGGTFSLFAIEQAHRVQPVGVNS